MGTWGGREKLFPVSQGRDSPGCKGTVVSFFSPIPDARMEVEKSQNSFEWVHRCTVASSDPTDLWVISRWFSHGT